ncbi:hypothetical protein [Oceanirhabdus sp. W0125-5]|uniref:hypothetical protein n=1 Tax=Oceanirhabdus sp. W0125-5 TaxID=2999116 RepID=UPI0022F2D15D|nr:hypothetical protein [Oceanirhabdus sp. W0125-5]WBW94748.1 hypothetical protein OW730_13685 [Oceanirhabdus sp. W0125-5]
MKKITYKELVEEIISNFEAPISLLELIGDTSRLINGLPITYLLRYISKKENDNEEGNGEYFIKHINDTLLKIEKDDRVFILEQDSSDNVLNFDIG